MRGLTILVLAIGQSMACMAADHQKQEIIAPLCKNPAPLHGQSNPNAPSYIVVLKDGTDVAKTTNLLGKKHGFTVQAEMSSLGMFSLQGLSAQQLASLRCEPQIKYIEHDSVVSIQSK